jgi:hypothetical protein
MRHDMRMCGCGQTLRHPDRTGCVWVEHAAHKTNGGCWLYDCEVVGVWRKVSA